MEEERLEFVIPKHPLARIPPRWRVWAFIGFVGATAAVGYLLGGLDEQLRSGPAPCGIVSLELAGCTAQVEAIVDAWRKDERVSQARRSLALDFLFIAGYAGSLSLLCLWGARLVSETAPAGAKALELLAWGQLVAGGLDILENGLLFLFLTGQARTPLPLVAASLAGTKFLLVGLVAPAVLGAVMVRLLRARSVR